MEPYSDIHRRLPPPPLYRPFLTRHRCIDINEEESHVLNELPYPIWRTDEPPVRVAARHTASAVG